MKHIGRNPSWQFAKMKNINGNLELEELTISSTLKDFYVPEQMGLIGAKCLNIIAGFAQRFPENLSSCFGYEIQLGNNKDQADFLICISNPASFRDFVDAEVSLDSENGFDTEINSGLDKFSLFWLHEGGNPNNPINNIWFEFDYEEIEKEHPKTCFFFGPKINLNYLEVLLLTEKVFDKIFNKKVEKQTLKILLEIYSALDKHSFISQIGMMNARNDEHLRLFVQGKSKNWTIPFLKKINYAHFNNASLVSMIECCSKNATTVDLDIDISSEIGNNLGIECYFNSTEKALAFLEMLIEKGLATTQKGMLLKNYMKSIKSDKNKTFQPAFSHFKIGFKPGIGFNSKAYFGYVAQTLAPAIIQTKPLKSN